MSILTDDEFGKAISVCWLPLLKYGRHRFRLSTTDAEDLAQQTMLKAWTNRQSFIDEGFGVLPWLLAILRNEASMLFRRRHMEAKHAAKLVISDVLSPEADAVIELKHVAKIVDQLSPVHRRAVINTALGYSIKERAGMEGAGEGALKTRTRRGRQVLRSYLGDIVAIT